MTDTVMVRALRAFDGVEGWKTPRSAPFDVPRKRAVELKAHGLVAEVTETKAAPMTETKVAPAVANKAAPATTDKTKASGSRSK